MVGPQHHSLVDVGHGSNAGLHQVNGFVDHWDQDLVNHEARSLGHLDGILADLLGQVIDEVEGLLGGVGTPDDFHQLHAWHGVEEMHADNGMVQTQTHLGNGQRRGVGGEDGLGLAQAVQLIQQLFLGGHVFLDALDDEIGVGAGGLLLHQNIGQQSVHGLLGHLALSHPLGQRSGQLILVLLGGSHATRIHQRRVALCRENLRDAAAHGTCSEYCYFHIQFSLIIENLPTVNCLKDSHYDFLMQKE